MNNSLIFGVPTWTFSHTFLDVEKLYNHARWTHELQLMRDGILSWKGALI